MLTSHNDLCTHISGTSHVVAARSLPLLVAAAIYMEYPPPGKGVGCRADSLPGLKFISNESAITHASVGLGADGTLQAGHAYAFIFIRPDSGCHKSLPRIETIWQRCQQQKKCHIILLSTATPEELEKYRKARESHRTHASLWPHGTRPHPLHAWHPALAQRASPRSARPTSRPPPCRNLPQYPAISDQSRQA